MPLKWLETNYLCHYAFFVLLSFFSFFLLIYISFFHFIFCRQVNKLSICLLFFLLIYIFWTSFLFLFDNMITKLITIKRLCSYFLKKTCRKTYEFAKGHVKRHLHFLVKRLRWRTCKRKSVFPCKTTSQSAYWGATISTLNLTKMEPRMLHQNWPWTLF